MKGFQLKKQLTNNPDFKILVNNSKCFKKMSHPGIKRKSTIRNTDLTKFKNRFSKKAQIRNRFKTCQNESSSSKESRSDKSLIKKYRQEIKELKEKQRVIEIEKQMMHQKIKKISDFLNNLTSFNM